MDGGDPAGGSRVLAELIDRHGGELVADFLHYYQIDLRELVRPGGNLTPRRTLALAQNLPLESSFMAAQQGGPQFRGWTISEYLLAALIDAVNHNTFAFVSANSKRKPQPPKPVERPKKVQKEKRNNLFALMAAEKFAAVRKAKEGQNG